MGLREVEGLGTGILKAIWYPLRFKTSSGVREVKRLGTGILKNIQHPLRFKTSWAKQLGTSIEKARSYPFRFKTRNGLKEVIRLGTPLPKTETPPCNLTAPDLISPSIFSGRVSRGGVIFFERASGVIQ